MAPLRVSSLELERAHQRPAHHLRVSRALALAAVVITACSSDDAHEVAEPAALGSLALEPCLYRTAVQCGTLEVPQVHAEPNGAKLRLRVLVGRARKSAPEPIVYLTGGPGGSARGSADFLTSRAEFFGRDVLLLEQRGNPLSEPALDCQLGPSAAISWNVNDATKETDRLAQCVSTYSQQGVRLEAFNTLESAHDIDDLRRAIGSEKVIVWGASYGARLAAAVGHEHPDSVAALVLEASVLGDRPYATLEKWNMFPSKVAAFAQWLAKACAANEKCASRYPGLDPSAEIAKAVERAKEKPVAIADGVVIDSADAMKLSLFSAMYSVRNAALFIRALWADNRGELDAFDARVRINETGARDYLRRVLVPTDDVDLSSTTNVVVDCYDTVRNWTDAGLAAIPTDGFSTEERAAMGTSLARSRATCATLPAPTLDPARFTALAGAPMPTLFLAGRLDPVTPIDWAESDRVRFPRSQVVSASCGMHGMFFADAQCVGTMLDAYFAQHATFDAKSMLPTACIEARCDPSSFALENDLMMGE